jgi:Flp pilus assembly protein TadD
MGFNVSFDDVKPRPRIAQRNFSGYDNAMFHANVFRRIQPLSALAAFLCIPLVLSTQTRDQFEIPKLIALSIWAVPLVLGRLLDSTRRRPTGLEIAFGLFVLVQAITSLPAFSIAWRTSVIGEYENFAGLSTTLILGAWFYGLGRGFAVSEFKRLHFFAVTAGILSALYAIAQSFGFDFVPWNPDTYNASRVFAGLGNPNFLSAYLAMSLPLLIDFALEEKTTTLQRPPASILSALLIGFALLLGSTGKGAAHLGLTSQDGSPLWFPGVLGLFLMGLGLTHPLFRRGTLAAWGGVLLLGIGLVTTGSRGGWLGALVGLALYAALRRAAKPAPETASAAPTNRAPWFRSPFVWGGTGCIGFLLFFGRPFFERLLQSTAHPLESLGRSRLTIWGPALKMLRDHPWTGIGPDCFKIAFPQYSAYDFNAIDGLFVSSRTAHNEWLQAAATSGFPGLLSLAAIVCFFFIFAVRRLRGSSPEMRSFWVAVLASGTAYLTQNLFSFGVAAILLLWTLHLGSVNRTPVSEEPKSPTPFAWMTAFLLSAFVLVPVGLRLNADLSFSHGMQVLDYLQQSASSMDDEKKQALASYSLKKTTRAADVFPWDVKYRLYTGMSLEQLADNPLENKKERLEQALAVYQWLSTQSPHNGYYSNDQGRVLTALARLDPARLPEAVQAQEQAASLSPENPFFLAQWGALLLLENKTVEASAPLTKAFAYDPTLSAKTLCQGAMEAILSGQKEGGWRLLDQAVALNPKSPEAWFFRGYFYKRDGKMKEAQFAMAKALELNPKLAELQQAAK